MHILITDSGVGGLSVVAWAERFVREHGAREPVRLTFANAAPANDYGYNSMATKEEKIETFDRFLRSVTERFAPDSVYVACNTLSVLLPETPFFTKRAVPTQGIVETGVSLVLRELESSQESVAIVFATETTIEAGTYPRLLEEHGIDASRIVAQACPGLASTISQDREGTRTRVAIRHCVDAALARIPECDAPVVAALACTHYGYRRELFTEAFAAAGIRSTVINPNERAVDDIFRVGIAGDVRAVEVDFVTRYAIPAETIEALTFFLEDISPRTVAAMKNFRHLPDLF